MAIPLSDNLNIRAPKLDSERYGPFLSVSAAITAVPAAYRAPGLFAIIMFNGLPRLYWWEGILDTDLKPFPVGGSTFDPSQYALLADVYTRLESDARFAKIVHYHRIGDVEGLQQALDDLVSMINLKANITYVNSHVATTRQELQDQIDAFQSGLLPQPSVATFNDLATTYPNPATNWLVITRDTGYSYRYNGTVWDLWSTSVIPIATATNDGRMAKEHVAMLLDHEFRISQLEARPPGGGGALVNPITIKGIAPNVLGKNSGWTWAAGTPQETVLRDILTKFNPANYTMPGLSISKNAPDTIMVGDEVGVVITGAFSQGDAGSLVTMRHRAGGTVFSTANPSSVYTLLFTAAGALDFQSSADYAQGPVKNNADGDPDPSGQIQAGTVTSGVQTIRGVFPWMSGSMSPDGGTPPASPPPAEIWAAAKRVEAIGSQITVNSFGTGARWLWFAVPQGSKTFTNWERSALDSGAIGGSSNLFRNAVTVSVSSVGLRQNWTRNYDLYMSNYATEASTPTRLF